MTTKILELNVPILRPHFVPPTYLYSQLQPRPTNIQPDMQYLKPINIIYPLYYSELAKYPQCLFCNDVSWEGWTTMCPCELHGVSHEETAIGLQFHCHSCKCKHGRSENSPAGDDSSYCFVLTSHVFGEGGTTGKSQIGP
ncbi:hypothetical protein HD554DRAFT_2019297 [Boletus coccyginus]|nr:hypothetical protein HD554DRAFT_2019297 [Boletus coccyginus]